MWILLTPVEPKVPITPPASSLQVLPFDDNICLREPCENYMKCVSVLKFDSSPPFIASNTVLFRPIHPINGLRCRCPLGFTGDYCETEVDLCYSGPCKNNGRCRSREGGYTCECLDDFTGRFFFFPARFRSQLSPVELDQIWALWPAPYSMYILILASFL